ncbi:uncharacterized protein DS421_1g30420 [Arachis hypogaea]|nr:uncharacterized protein DS421_1g30420 [Arachis hypogaea]
MSTLIATVRNLFTTPVTVNAVAETAFLAAKPKKLIANQTHRIAQQQQEHWDQTSSGTGSQSIENLKILTGKEPEQGRIMRDNKLLYKTKPQVFNPRFMTMCLM